jgi:hypothetical protein
MKTIVFAAVLFAVTAASVPAFAQDDQQQDAALQGSCIPGGFGTTKSAECEINALLEASKKIPDFAPRLQAKLALQDLLKQLKTSGECSDLKAIETSFNKIKGLMKKFNVESAEAQKQPLLPDRHSLLSQSSINLLQGLAGISPLDLANTAPVTKSISVGLGGSDSFNREVKVTGTAQLPWGQKPMGTSLTGAWHPEVFSTGCSQYLFNANVTYDDKWKPTSATSNLTQQYSGELLHFSNLFGGVHTVLMGGAYHDNSQGIAYDVEPAVGVFGRWPNEADPSSPKHQFKLILGLAAQADIESLIKATQNTALGGLRTYFLWQWKPKTATGKDAKGIAQVFKDKDPKMCEFLVDPKTDPKVNEKACKLLLDAVKTNGKPDQRHTFAFNLKGFLPAVTPTVYGHASAMASYDYKLTTKFSLSFSVLDTYYSTVSAGYSHNSLTPAFSLKWTPPAAGAGG